MSRRDFQRNKLLQDGHKAIALFNQGLSQEQVSKALGRSRMTIWRALKAVEVPHTMPVEPVPTLERDPLLDGYEELEPAPADEPGDLDDLLR